MKTVKTISIKCDTKDAIDWHSLTEFQGGLKIRDDADISKAKTSILKYGWSFPFFVWASGKTNYVLDGHCRMLVLKALEEDGYIIPELPCVYIQAKNKAEAKQKLLRLNSTYGKMTKESVLEFAEDIEIDFDEIALPDTTIVFSDEQTEDASDTSGDDDAPALEEGQPVSQFGEMYELGNSILMCGDSTDESMVARLMAGTKADCVFSDPPYGMGLDTDFSSMKNKQSFAQEKNIKNGKKYAQGVVDEFAPKMIEMLLSLNAKETFLWGADYYAELIEEKNNGSWIVWDKRASADGDIEKDESSDKMYGSCFELCWSRNKHKRDIARVKWASVFGTEQEFDHKRFHPTQKPIKLAEWFLTRYTEEEQTVVDLFGGSGCTLIACEKNNRKCRMMELDPHYCDVIRRRYTRWAKENNRPLTSGCLE